MNLEYRESERLIREANCIADAWDYEVLARDIAAVRNEDFPGDARPSAEYAARVLVQRIGGLSQLRYYLNCIRIVRS
jgi:hypothetical protein